MKAIKPNFDLDLNRIIKQQSVEIEGQPGVRRSPVVRNNEFVEYLYDDARTVLECFLHGVKVSENGPCFGYRPEKKEVPYVWITYKQSWEIAKGVGSGILENDMKLSDFIGIYSQNTVEWALMDKACCAYSLVSVPLYDTLGDDSIQFIINQCELRMIMVDTPSKAKRLIQFQSQGKMKTLKYIVIVDEVDQETIALASEKNMSLITWKTLEQIGREHIKELIPPKIEDLYSIVYTSGTSGIPKGVMVTHRMMVSQCSSGLAYQGAAVKDIENHVLFSYLPLPHIYERFMHVCCHMVGSSIGFFRGDVRFLLSDLVALKPSGFNMVPRVMNKLHDKILAQVHQSYFKSKLFHFALNRKLAALKHGTLHTNTIWDKLVFSKTRALVGGKVQSSFTGASAISPQVLNFTRIVFGVGIAEGYGMTEGSGGFTCTIEGDYTGGNVGSLSCACHIKLIDVPQMGYYAKNNQGEICARGPIVMKGYYKEPEKTKEAIDEYGWLHTGDIGEWLPNGALKIVDRKKDIFKLSQGEYISPEKLEQIFVMMVPIAQVFVYGMDVKSSLIGIVIPDEESVFNWCKENRVTVPDTLEELCKSKAVKDLLVDEMAKFGRHHKLKSYELLKDIYLSAEVFSVDNNLLSPTFKSKRIEIIHKYKTQLDGLYENIE